MDKNAKRYSSDDFHKFDKLNSSLNELKETLDIHEVILPEQIVNPFRSYCMAINVESYDKGMYKDVDEKKNMIHVIHPMKNCYPN